MKLKTCLAALVLCSAAPMAMAADPSCANVSSGLGSIGPAGAKPFGKSFNNEGTYYDCFTFSLASQVDSLSGELQLDPALKTKDKDIDIKSVEVFLNGAIVQDSDKSLHKFSFGSLVGGGAVYTLQVVSYVTDLGNNGNDKVKKMGKEEEKGKDKDNVRVGYIGKITTVAAPVPEPAAYALAVMGLIVVGAAALRRKPS